jgi:thiamine kinase-like enzyme
MLKLMLSKPWRTGKYSKMLAQCHVSIQKNVIIQTETVKEKLRRDIESVSLLDSQEKQLIINYLEALPDGDSICHFDFHPDNIMISANQYYVIDWMTACVGDPLSDIATTAVILNYAEIPRVPAFVNRLVRTLQKSIYRRYLREYVHLTVADFSDIQKWELPIAAARLCEWIPDGESKGSLRW